MGGLCTGDVHIGAVCQGCALGGVLVCVLGAVYWSVCQGCVLVCVLGLCTRGGGCVLGMCTGGCVLGLPPWGGGSGAVYWGCVVQGYSGIRLCGYWLDQCWTSGWVY